MSIIKLHPNMMTNYPANLDDILPTQFGNVLRAAEDHADSKIWF